MDKYNERGFPGGSVVKNPPAAQEIRAGGAGDVGLVSVWERPPREGNGTHASSLA